MFKLFKNAFKITNEGIILATPLVLFIWLITWYIHYSREFVDTFPEVILSVVTLLFMFSAFLSGWFYMVKECVEFSKKDFILDNDRARESLKLIKSLQVGVGKYFLTYIGVSLVFLAMVLLIAYALYYISVPIIKEMNFSLAQMSTAINSPQEVANFINSLPPEQLFALFKLNILLMVLTSVFSFLTMLWMPEIIYTNSNPVTSLFTSVKKLFKKFGKSLLLYIYITLLNYTISFISSFAFLHPLAYMILMIVYFYFIVYVVVLIFSYYDREFNEETEAEDHSSNGSDSERQD